MGSSFLDFGLLLAVTQASFCETLTQQGASRRLPNGNIAEEKARGPAVPWVHVVDDLACAGTCGSGDALGAGGVEFRLGMGSVTRDDRSEGTGRGSQSPVRRYICASLVTRKETRENPLRHPLSKPERYGSGPEKTEAQAGIGPVPRPPSTRAAVSKRRHTRGTACSIFALRSPFCRKTCRVAHTES